jgi:hypothetical protein
MVLYIYQFLIFNRPKLYITFHNENPHYEIFN